MLRAIEQLLIDVSQWRDNDSSLNANIFMLCWTSNFLVCFYVLRYVLSKQLMLAEYYRKMISI